MKKLEDRNGAGTNEDPRVVSLCGVQGCCPQVQILTDEVNITDDSGGSVKLTRAEFAELGKVAQ